MAAVVLVLGGARSGKSEVGERRAAELAALTPSGVVTYVATGWAPDGSDPGWQARVAAHRLRRPPTWTTVEVGADLASCCRRPPATCSSTRSGPGWRAPTASSSTSPRCVDALAERAGATVRRVRRGRPRRAPGDRGRRRLPRRARRREPGRRRRRRRGAARRRRPGPRSCREGCAARLPDAAAGRRPPARTAGRWRGSRSAGAALGLVVGGAWWAAAEAVRRRWSPPASPSPSTSSSPAPCTSTAWPTRADGVAAAPRRARAAPSGHGRARRRRLRRRRGRRRAAAAVGGAGRRSAPDAWLVAGGALVRAPGVVMAVALAHGALRRRRARRRVRRRADGPLVWLGTVLAPVGARRRHRRRRRRGAVARRSARWPRPAWSPSGAGASAA